MFVELCEIHLFIPGISSLKEKRRVINSLRDRLRGRFNVSVSEVEHQDLWQRATLGIALVGGSASWVRDAMDRVLQEIDRDIRVEVIEFHRELV